MTSYIPTKEALVIESMFNVVDRDGKVKPFTLNNAQRKLDSAWTGRDLVPKARRLGVTTYVLARQTAACLMYHNINAVVISHEREATQRMLQTVRFFIENLRGPGAVIKNLSKNRISFGKTGSEFFIGTAGSTAFGRGDTIHRLHCSEFAYWPDAEGLFSGLVQAVSPSGEISIESTGNGMDGYAQRCVRAWERKEGIGPRYTCHFLNWLDEPAHRIEMEEEEEKAFMKTLDLDLGEPELSSILTPAQLAFRRYKIVEELNYDIRKFQQEYPLSLSECFQSSGSTVFWKVNFKHENGWKRVDRNAHALENHPVKGNHYLLGVDPSGGTGNDNAVVEGFCLETNEQVYEWASNTCTPDALASVVARIGETLNNAFVSVENNNHGILTLSELSKIYPSHLIYTPKSNLARDEIPSITKMGFRTTESTKPLAIGRLRKALAGGGLVIYSPELKSELDTYIEDEAGKLRAADGFRDDRVMAAAVGLVCWSEAAVMGTTAGVMSPPSAVDPFTLQGLIDELGRRGGSFPIPPQHLVH